MKKYIWLFIFLLSVPLMKAELRFGVKGGLNVASAHFKKSDFKAKNVTGFHIGPVIDFSSRVSGLGIDGALLYSRKGFNGDDDNMKSDYIDIPVNLKWKFNGLLVKPYIAAGPYISCLVGGDKNRDMNDMYHNFTGKLKAKTFGAGLNFSAGVELFSKLQVGLTYDLGLTENYKVTGISHFDNIKGKNETWALSAAIFF